MKKSTTRLAIFLLLLLSLSPARAVTDEEKEVPERLTENASAYEEIRLLTEVLLHVRKLYVDEKSYEEIIQGALHGMLGELDEHSDFLDSDAFKAMREGTSSSFTGIGIHIGMRDGIPTVIAPIEDTPAFRAGLMAGDKIVEIDGARTQGKPLRDAVDKLRGPRGEKVVVTIVRKGEDEPREVEIVRDDITVPSVKGARILNDGVGYVRITQFSRPTADALQRALNDLMAQGMNGLVLDLRSNPGGLLASAIDVAQKFLKRKQLIVTTKGREGPKRELDNRAEGRHHYVDFPMAVLVNRGSASASEIVAGALQDNKRAVLVGETTFGKGSVQSIIPLESKGRSTAIRITTARYYTPSGREIHGKGIEPDIPVSISVDEWRDVLARRARVENPIHYVDEDSDKYEHVVDRQLQRAVDLVQALKIFNHR